MGKYAFTEEQKKQANEIIGKQKRFKTEQEALKEALKPERGILARQVWKEPDGDYIAATRDAWEWMDRLGYKRIHSTSDLLRMRAEGTDTIEEI